MLGTCCTVLYRPDSENHLDAEQKFLGHVTTWGNLVRGAVIALRASSTRNVESGNVVGKDAELLSRRKTWNQSPGVGATMRVELDPEYRRHKENTKKQIFDMIAQIFKHFIR